MRRAGVGIAGAAAVVAAVLASCSPVSGPGWRQVGLAAQAAPSSLAVVGEDLLIGGVDAAGPSPFLVRVDPGGRQEAIALTPDQGYARVADLVSLSPAGTGLLALGVARGGAHGNQRWTAWQGPAAGPVRDHQQDFMTFGGHEAGPLLGIVRVGDRPVVVGSRGGASGFYAALWTLSGTTWTRQPTSDPSLVSSPDRVLSFRAAAVAGGELVIAGAEVGLAGAVRQAPVLWAGTVEGAWRTVPLAIPGELATATGLAQATSVACGTPAACWVAGWVRGRPVVWEVDLVASTSQATVLEGSGGSATDPVAVLGLVGEEPVVFTNADQPLVTWRCGGQWRTAPAPGGRASAVAAVAGRVYVVAGDDSVRGLWEAVLDPSAC